MPNNPQTLIENLSKKADRITDAIERKEATVDRALYVAERDLFALIVEQFISRLAIRDGVVENTAANLTLLSTLDRVFDQFQREVLGGAMPVFVDSLFDVVAMTGELYTGMQAATVLDAITKDNAVIRAAIGVDNGGNVLRGTVLWDVSNAAPVRDGLKNVVLKAIQSGDTLQAFTKSVKDYVTGTPGTQGRLRSYYRTYAYDLFNQVQEAKNEQFRRGLDLQWFLYVGDVIRDSRVFCAKKAGKVFAIQEADAEWPKDADLIGKSTGIPYTPRIDRGRWNCRHRIRYITEEMAAQIDAAKVKRIKQKYGGSLSN
jgi:hypothetical protein